MTRRSGFRASDLARALKVAQQAGLTASRIEIEADGKLVLSFVGSSPDAEKSAAQRSLDELRARLRAGGSARPRIGGSPKRLKGEA